MRLACNWCYPESWPRVNTQQRSVSFPWPLCVCLLPTIPWRKKVGYIHSSFCFSKFWFGCLYHLMLQRWSSLWFWFMKVTFETINKINSTDPGGSWKHATSLKNIRKDLPELPSIPPDSNPQGRSNNPAQEVYQVLNDLAFGVEYTSSFACSQTVEVHFLNTMSHCAGKIKGYNLIWYLGNDKKR